MRTAAAYIQVCPDRHAEETERQSPTTFRKSCHAVSRASFYHEVNAVFVVLKRKSIIIAVAFVLAAAALTAALGASGSAGVFFGVSSRKIPVYCVERTDDEEKVIALTFDAAWGADKTQGIMDILDEYDAGGTFFLVGFWLDKYPDMTQEIAERGFEIGNHSANHLNMPKLNDETMRAEISSVNARIEQLAGVKPKFFRAPYGDYSDRLMTAVEGEGMVGVQWSIDTLDWKGLSAAQIVERVVPKAKSGDIVLFHNNSDHVLEALPLVLMAFKNKGFRFVGLSEMVATENFTVDHAGVQHKDA